MKFLAVTGAIALACMLSGCSYAPKEMMISTPNVYSSYSGKLPGTYLLYVDGASELDIIIRPSGLSCSAHKFPAPMATPFLASISQAIGNMAEGVQMVGAPVDRSALSAAGARGMVIVKIERVNARLQALEGFASATVETEIEINASITVDGRMDRLLGLTVSGDGSGQSSSGFACEGGATSVAQAAEDSIKDTVTRLVEAMVNSQRVRTGS